MHQPWPMQSEDQRNQGSAAQAGEEYCNWLQVYYAHYQEQEDIHQEEGGDDRTQHPEVGPPWPTVSGDHQVIWWLAEGLWFLEPVHSAHLVYECPSPLHGLTRCHSDRPSLAVPDTPGAVPHHCGDQ